ARLRPYLCGISLPELCRGNSYPEVSSAAPVNTRFTDKNFGIIKISVFVKMMTSCQNYGIIFSLDIVGCLIIYKEIIRMIKVFENQEMMVLSNKEFIENDGYVLIFGDGSSVDVPTRTVVNKGLGEIVIKDLPLWPQMTEVLKEQMTFEAIQTLNISGDMNNVIILPNEGSECFVSIGGTDDFAQNTSVYQQGNELHIETPKNNSNIHVNIGSVWINGKRLPPQLEENFGYIEIKCNSLHNIYVNGSGSGEIYSQVPLEYLKVKIQGSTSIDAIKLEKAELNISGSGSLSADELNGYLFGRISGSGSIDILSGLIENVDVAISGSGNLVIGATIKTANLSLSGSGDMMIAHVMNEYTEQKTGSGFIRVLKKGNTEV
ncbi:MAG: DUF2807 domain-containing protein, partial [Oscillospiraceae bacterium]|nr:DUF2807 domain-containing protein [Oscillospiraceae bacterium]